MKKLFNNSYLVISLYLLTTFIIDIMTNLSINLSFSIGYILRTIILIYFILGLFIKYKKKENYIILSMIFSFSVIYLIINHTNQDYMNIFNYLNILVLLLYMYNLYKSEDKKINRNIITLCLLFYASTICISYILNGKLLFTSINEISTIISITLPYLFINLEKRINFIEILTIGVSLWASIILGTRLPLIIFLICLLYLLLKKLIKDAKKGKVNYVNIILFILFIIAFIYKFSETPIYKNIYDKVKTLNLNNPIDIFTDFKLFDHFIFNGRLHIINSINKAMTSSLLKYKLFGLPSFNKFVGMDIFELLYKYGVIGFSLFIFIAAYLIRKFKSSKNINYFPIIIILITSIFSGFMLSANVSIIAIVILSNTIYKRNHKKVLISSYDLNTGGIESALVTFIKKLSKENYEITLYLENKEGYLLKELPSSVIVKRQKVFNYRNPLIRKPLNMLNKAKFLLTNFKEYDFSVCYATYSMSSNFLARNASNNNAIYIHSDYTVFYKNDIDKINKFFNIRKLDKFKNIVFVSNESKDNLLAYYPRLMDKSIVINNFIDTDKIINGSKEKVKEVKPRGKKLFVFVGRIDEVSKNFTRMIYSFKKVYEKNKKFELWIIGDGPDYKNVVNLIKDNNLEDNIKMLGKRNNPYPYINMADYLILTSNYEGFPVVYGEAITLNKPIITTIDVSDESIKIPQNFGIVTKKNETDISSVILNILDKNDFKPKKIDIDEVNNKKLKMIKDMISR